MNELPRAEPRVQPGVDELDLAVARPRRLSFDVLVVAAWAALAGGYPGLAAGCGAALACGAVLMPVRRGGPARWHLAGGGTAAALGLVAVALADPVGAQMLAGGLLAAVGVAGTTWYGRHQHEQRRGLGEGR